MKKYNVLTLISLTVISLGCEKKSNSDSVIINDGIVEINVLKAFEDHRDFPLSKLVKDVELLKLESTHESYFENANTLQVGDKYILISCTNQNKVYLFNRSGKFIRTIGRFGAGPGEYNRGTFVTMCPSEENIILVDFMSKKIVRYGIDGTFIKQKDISGFCSNWPTQTAPFFIDKSHFAFSRSRPYAQVDNFYTIYVLDLELNLVNKFLPHPNNDSLCLSNLFHRTQSIGPNGPYYWETFTDTLFYLSSYSPPIPAYSFVIDKNKHTLKSLKDRNMNQKDEDLYQIGGIIDLTKYLVCWCKLETSCWLIYDKKNQEAFVTYTSVECQKPINTWINGWIKNDVYGFQPSFQSQNPDNNTIATIFNPAYIEATTSVSCINDLEVTHPETRDQLVDFCQNYSGDELPILIIMHLK